MRFLDTGALIGRLEHHLTRAEQVDVAVAWATCGPALDRLVTAAMRGVQVRAVVGLSGGYTHPNALRLLHRAANLRIAEDAATRHGPGGIFHPKVFVFHSAREGKVAWIGSANLTDGGFARNFEAVWEVSQADALAEWFRDLWVKLPADPGPSLTAYAAGWKPPPANIGSKKAPKVAAPPRPTVGDGTPTNWAGYVDLLSAADAYWSHRATEFGEDFSVLGSDRSWLATIQEAGSIVRAPSWAGLADDQRRAVLGISKGIGSWALLGSMGGAGHAKQIFGGATDARRATLARLRKALDPLIAAEGVPASIDAAVGCLEAMSSEPGISYGVATRLMTVARPDVAVSVNAGSAPHIGALTGLPRTPSALASTKNYRALLNWVARQPWHGVPRPSDPWQATLWHARAALLDCFVYEPT